MSGYSTNIYVKKFTIVLKRKVHDFDESNFTYLFTQMKDILVCWNKANGSEQKFWKNDTDEKNGHVNMI